MRFCLHFVSLTAYFREMASISIAASMRCSTGYVDLMFNPIFIKQHIFAFKLDIAYFYFLDMMMKFVLAGKDHESSLWTKQRLFYILIISCLLQSDYHLCSLCWSFTGTIPGYKHRWLIHLILQMYPSWFQSLLRASWRGREWSLQYLTSDSWEFCHTPY